MTGPVTEPAKDELRGRIVAFLPRLRRFCRGLAGGDGDRGDDLLQAAVERALSRLDQWQPGTSLENWIFKLTTNLHIDQIRSQRARGIAVELEEAFELPGENELERLEFRSELEAVRAALTAMPPDLRNVMTAVVLDGHSYRDAAELLAVPIGTVMSRLARARQFVEVYVRRGPERMVAA
ncbi:RNA polymerase sigma factor [Novosphingobium piscinae]|uniref:RNA polymerase sigma factor n=1 Tax=Novosphingobium piscinae TaxID=1507448 RepID=A0A7X1G0F9_9SPHN|nr:RNA polymerase sigma factor [Novosphingobium piscinae]MBC2669662.1 RNA polymerase sigma factor [Novosphingobium piscinae]